MARRADPAQGEIWGIDDPRTLATLWWYSASTWLVTPAVHAITWNIGKVPLRHVHFDIIMQPISASG